MTLTDYAHAAAKELWPDCSPLAKDILLLEDIAWELSLKGVQKKEMVDRLIEAYRKERKP
jgi:hypothetical protein